jgi:hypothetical protein
VKIILRLLLLVICLTIAKIALATDSPVIQRSVIAGAGETVIENHGSLILTGSLGEPAAGVVIGSGDYGLMTGYWVEGIFVNSDKVYLPVIMRNK